MGPEASPAVPALAKARMDENEDVRAAADEALKKIGTPDARKALEMPIAKSKPPKRTKK